MRRNARSSVVHRIGFGLAALTEDQLESVHYATTELLGVTGVKVVCEEAVELLAEAGAVVERHKGFSIVKIPSWLLEDCLRWSPRKTIYYGRKSAHDFIAEPNRVGYSTFGECIQVIDLNTRRVRQSKRDDLRLFCRLCDYYEELDVMVRPLSARDKPPELQPLYNLGTLLQSTSKHILIGPHKGRNVSKMIEMAALSVGSREKFEKRPHITMFACPTSPLTLGKECCEIAMETARLGLGLAIIPMALSGATSTATLAGTLVSHNAETLSVLALAQLARKGTPCTYCSMSTIMDLKNMVGAVGAPEHGMLSAAAVKMAQYYRLPSLVGGGISDSKIPDAQAGYEYSMNALLTSLAGANVIYGAGALEMGLTSDFAKLVMDVEAIRYIKKITGGFPVDDEGFALEVINSVGPAGEFLSSEHTFKHMREQSQGRSFDRRNRPTWERKGEKNATERAYGEAKDILDKHEPAPLPDGAEKEIEALLAEAEKRLQLG